MSRTRLRSATVVDFRASTRRPTAGCIRARVPAIGLGVTFGALAGWLCGASVRSAVAISDLIVAPLRTSIIPASGTGPPTSRGPKRTDPPSGIDATSVVPPVTEGANAIQDDTALSASASRVASGQAECDEGMRLVEGEYCSVVAHRCVEPYTDGSGRCGRYAAFARCYPPIFSLRFCMDEFEYPNRRGEKARVMVTFGDAVCACEAEGKRLCTAREWTLACEGPERLPYPTGNVRDRSACNIDLAHRFPDTDALNNVATVQRELERLDQRIPSGSMPQCVSAYGIYDLMGNVDEWVVPDGPEEAAGFGSKTALKGGYFGPVRARCRPSTPSHGPTFKFYQVGFRCCSESTPKIDNESGR